VNHFNPGIRCARNCQPFWTISNLIIRWPEANSLSIPGIGSKQNVERQAPNPATRTDTRGYFRRRKLPWMGRLFRSYTACTASTSGCFTGDGESCAIYDFYYDANAQCTAGEAQTYCGQYCCVSPAPCTNNRVVCP